MLTLTVAACLTTGVHAQDESADKPEERTTGLPDIGTWTFNIDVGLGAFGFDNSLYGNARPDPSGDLSDNWLESFVKPALSGDFPLGDSALVGKISAVGTRTFSAPPTIAGDEASAFDIEDLYLGWRSGTLLGDTEDLLSATVGRTRYELGNGMLIWDGAGDGGSRGGYWSGARKAWEYAGIGRVKFGYNLFEAFYLDRDELPENDTHTKLYGGNYELAIEERFKFGVTYVKAQSDLELRDGMDLQNARIFAAPFAKLPGLSFEAEYALEENGGEFESTAWWAQIGFELSDKGWAPKLTYRYAIFEGDDPGTTRVEAFDSLFPGFYDWGTWWQGEIAGEYFLVNSNLISHQIRVGVSPTEDISASLFFYDFTLDHPATFAPGVTSDAVAQEIDLVVDWSFLDNFTASVVLAYAEPKEAVEQGFGRTASMRYGMLYLAYAY